MGHRENSLLDVEKRIRKGLEVLDQETKAGLPVVISGIKIGIITRQQAEKLLKVLETSRGIKPRMN